MGAKNHQLTTIVDLKLQEKFRQAEQRKTSIEDFTREFILQFLSKETQKAYMLDLQDFFLFMQKGNTQISGPGEIRGHHFQLYRDHLLENNYSSATINRKLVAVRSFMKWCLASKIIDHNPLDIIKLPKVRTESPTIAFDDKEVLQMISSPDCKTRLGQIHRLVLVFLFNLGLRRSELANIRLQDIFQDRSHLVLRIKGKGDKERLLPINSFVEKELKEFLYQMNVHGHHWSPGDYLFTSKLKENKPINGTTVYRIVERYAKLCGINKQVGAHSCRATAISHLLDTHQVPIRDVAIFAGHSNITTTERYDKRRKNLDNSAAYQVNFAHDPAQSNDE